MALTIVLYDVVVGFFVGDVGKYGLEDRPGQDRENATNL